MHVQDFQANRKEVRKTYQWPSLSLFNRLFVYNYNPIKAINLHKPMDESCQKDIHPSSVSPQSYKT